MIKWIKCSERLPESEDNSVLVYSANGTSDGKGFSAGGFDMVHIQDYFDDITNGFDENGNQLYTKWYIHQGITHWMAFPDLPVGEN